MTATEEPDWPSDRGSYSGIILQFGRTRAATDGSPSSASF